MDWAVHSLADLHRGPCVYSHSTTKALWVVEEAEVATSIGMAGDKGCGGSRQRRKALRKALKKGKDPLFPRSHVE